MCFSLSHSLFSPAGGNEKLWGNFFGFQVASSFVSPVLIDHLCSFMSYIVIWIATLPSILNKIRKIFYLFLKKNFIIVVISWEGRKVHFATEISGRLFQCTCHAVTRTEVKCIVNGQNCSNSTFRGGRKLGDHILNQLLRFSVSITVPFYLISTTKVGKKRQECNVSLVRERARPGWLSLGESGRA